MKRKYFILICRNYIEENVLVEKLIDFRARETERKREKATLM